jgi:hypothetical protein
MDDGTASSSEWADTDDGDTFDDKAMPLFNIAALMVPSIDFPLETRRRRPVAPRYQVPVHAPNQGNSCCLVARMGRLTIIQS